MLADELDAPCRDQRIDVMIGANQLRHVIFNRQTVDLSNGLQASRFGLLMLGPIDDPVRVRDQAAAVALNVIFSSPGTDDQLHRDLKHQWALDALGISPQEPTLLPITADPVYQRFADTIEMEDKVRLPWTEGRDSRPDCLPRNEKLARGCLQSQLSRLRRRPEILEQVTAVFVDHLERGFIKQVPEKELYA